MRLVAIAALSAVAATVVPAEGGRKIEDPSGVAVFAGGCFWCMEPPFDKIDGVRSTVSGYIGGSAEDANYRQVTTCLLYTSPSPRDGLLSRMPSSA